MYLSLPSHCPIPSCTDDVSPLLALLPKDIATSLLAQTEAALLCDINLDVGRQPHAWCAGQRVFLSSEARLVSRSDIQHVVEQLGSFGSDNRAGLEAQLHRISAIMNRERVPIGLTMRVGRHVQGNADMMADILLGRDGMPVSVLLLGEPGRCAASTLPTNKLKKAAAARQARKVRRGCCYSRAKPSRVLPLSLVLVG